MRLPFFTPHAPAVMLDRLDREMTLAAHRILQFWVHHMLDKEYGGCYGMMKNDVTLVRDADKGLVLQTRTLWSFAYAARAFNDPLYSEIANQLYDFLVRNLYDAQNGGFYWSVDFSGQPADTNKQIYGQAFAIYALAEYFALTGDPQARTLALNTFHLMLEKCTDPSHGLLLNSYDRNWNVLSDFTITESQHNEPFHSNTLLHVVEAWNNLYMHTGDATVHAGLHRLMKTLLRVFMDSQGYMHMYLCADLTPVNAPFSAGHEFEFIWISLWSARLLNDPVLDEEVHRRAYSVGDNLIRHAIDKSGTIYDIKEIGGKRIKERRWWDQAETMMGLWSLYEETGDVRYLRHCWRNWQYVRQHFVIKNIGEWRWNVLSPEIKRGWRGYLAGPWKTPYHSVRACVEIAQASKRGAISARR